MPDFGASGNVSSASSIEDDEDEDSATSLIDEKTQLERASETIDSVMKNHMRFITKRSSHQ